MKTRIIQISDMHLNLDEQLTFGANGNQQFLQALEAATSLDPSAIVLSGDFCLDKPDDLIYPWVKTHLQKTNIPYYAIAGNHDDSRQLANVFHPKELKNRELYYAKRIGGHFIVFLDSSAGRFSRTQWLWLEEQINLVDEPIHIFMHHPPVYAGAPHMDNHHAFIDQEQFIDLMNRLKRPLHVYSGHYHSARYIQHKNINIHIAPSTLFQINPYTLEFNLESTTAGFQVIDIEENRVATSIYWLTN